MNSAPLQAAAMALLGWTTGYLASRPSVAPLSENPPPPRHSPRSAPVAAGTFAPPAYPPLPSHDLAALMRIDWRRLWLSEVEIRLSRMDNATLKRLLAEADADRTPSCAKTNLCSRIIREIYQREKVGAVAWAAEQPFHPEMLGKFIQYLAHDDVAAAIAWMPALDDKAARHVAAGTNCREGDMLSTRLQCVSALQRAAIAQGADAMREVHRKFGPLDLSNSFQPDGLDHAAWVARLGMEEFMQCKGKGAFLEAWGCHNRDAAFACAVEVERQPSSERLESPVAAVFRAVCAMEGETGAARWLSARLAAEPPEQRDGILTGIDPIGFAYLPPQAFAAMVEGMANEDDRVALAAGFIRECHNPDLARTYLQGMPSTVRRVAVIEAAAKAAAARSLYGANKRGYFAALTNDPAFPPAARARILALWPAEGP